MNKIYELELAMKTNKEAIKKQENNTSELGKKEYRSLLLQRAALKDKLLQAYRERYLKDIKLKENV